METRAKRSRGWKNQRPKSDTHLLRDVKKKSRPRSQQLCSESECDEQAAKYECMPEQVVKEAILMLEVRNAKRRVQSCREYKVQLIMSTSYSMNSFGKKRFILLCSTSGSIFRRRKRCLSLSLADIHAIYPGPVPNSQAFVVQTSARILLFRAPTDSIMLDWVAEIKAALAWENANGFLPPVFHIRTGPDQQVPMTDALLVFHPRRQPEQLMIRQALSETTLYKCHLQDVTTVSHAVGSDIIWVEAKPRESPLDKERFSMQCPGDSRDTALRVLISNIQDAFGGVGCAILAPDRHQVLYTIQRPAGRGPNDFRNRLFSQPAMGVQARVPRRAIRRHPNEKRRSAIEAGATLPQGMYLRLKQRALEKNEKLAPLNADNHNHLSRQRSRSMGALPLNAMPGDGLYDSGEEFLDSQEAMNIETTHDQNKKELEDRKQYILELAKALHSTLPGSGPIATETVPDVPPKQRSSKGVKDNFEATQSDDNFSTPLAACIRDSLNHRAAPDDDLAEAASEHQGKPPVNSADRDAMCVSNSTTRQPSDSLGNSENPTNGRSPCRHAIPVVEVIHSDDSPSSEHVEPYTYDHLRIHEEHKNAASKKSEKNISPPAKRSVGTRTDSNTSWPDNDEYMSIEFLSGRRPGVRLREDELRPPTKEGNSARDSIFSCVSALPPSKHHSPRDSPIKPIQCRQRRLRNDDPDYDIPKPSRPITIISPLSESPSVSSLSEDQQTVEKIVSSLYKTPRTHQPYDQQNGHHASRSAMNHRSRTATKQESSSSESISATENTNLLSARSLMHRASSSCQNLLLQLQENGVSVNCSSPLDGLSPCSVTNDDSIHLTTQQNGAVISKHQSRGEARPSTTSDGSTTLPAVTMETSRSSQSSSEDFFHTTMSHLAQEIETLEEICTSLGANGGDYLS